MKCKFCNSEPIYSPFDFPTGYYNYVCSSCNVYYWVVVDILECLIDNYCIFFRDDKIEISFSNDPFDILASVDDLSKLGTCNARDFLNRYLALKAFF